VLYDNGFGQTTPAFSNGQLELPGSNIPLAATPTITFNSVAANAVFAGLNASGLYQLNVVVPAGLPDGDAAVVATVGGYNSPSGAFITIKNYGPAGSLVHPNAPFRRPEQSHPLDRGRRREGPPSGCGCARP
jgi:hypothetical protein